MLKFGDAIKMLLTARSAMKRISANNSDFRLYKLLKNNSRLFKAKTGKPQHRLFDALVCQPSSAFLSCRKWWRMTGSNRRPPACKAGALPAELNPHLVLTTLVGLVGFEPTTPALSRRCSNRLSYRPTRLMA